MVESQREQRRIRCSGCQQHIWLRYDYSDTKPLTAVGIDCPRDACRKLNRVYMPASATGIEVGEEPSPETSTAASSPEPSGEATSAQGEEPAPVPETPPDPPANATPGGEKPRRNYWRPPRF